MMNKSQDKKISQDVTRHTKMIRLLYSLSSHKKKKKKQKNIKEKTGKSSGQERFGWYQKKTNQIIKA